jgi:hypothetical protein
MKEAQLTVAALNHYRRLVALLYREIGVLRDANHSLARKAKAKDPLFQNETRKSRARDIYRATLSQTEPQKIAAAYESRSGLSLKEVHEAFASGQWKNRSGEYSFGGPRWALIAETALKLGVALEHQRVSELSGLIATVLTLEHNNGRITQKYSQLD